MDGRTPPLLSARPYRSHKVPACDRCRSRKTRCDIDGTGQPCRFCCERGEACSYTLNVRQTKRKRLGGRGSREVQSPLEEESTNQTTPTESSLMMNPPMSEDITILEHYLTPQAGEGSATGKPYSTISNTPGNPIVYLSVPRRRKGLRSATDPGKMQREIIENILHPFADEVRKL